MIFITMIVAAARSFQNLVNGHAFEDMRGCRCERRAAPIGAGLSLQLLQSMGPTVMGGRG